MSSRKKQNLELESKKRSKNRLTTGITALVLLVIVAAIAWFVWDTHSQGWVMRFEGTRISVSDYNLKLAMWGDEDHAINALVQALTLLERANNAGVGFSDSELEEMRFATHMNLQFSGLDHIIEVDRATELINLDIIQQRLFDFYRPEYTPDEAEFAEAFQEFLPTAEPDWHADIQVMYITSPNTALLESIRSLSGTPGFDFARFVEDTSFHYSEADGVQIVQLRDLFQEHLVNLEQATAMLALQPGEVSIVATSSEELDIIVYVVSREEATEQEIEEAFREHYIMQGSIGLFGDLVNEWIANANFTLNNRLR